jgi:hypothetical protein
MKERETFLKSRKIRYRSSSWVDHMYDALQICGVVVTSTGFVSALFMTFPEPQEFPVTCLQGWDKFHAFI